MIEPIGRQDGRTSQQMKEAAQGAIFVWCNRNLGYPRALAQSLSRPDLRIEPLSWAENQKFLGCRVQIVVDHAAYLPGYVRHGIDAINAVFGDRQVK